MKSFLASTLLFFTLTNASGQRIGGWYKTLTGKMGNMDAVVHLTADSSYNGYIWFLQNQYPIQLTGNASKGDSVLLGGMDAALNITLSGILKNGEYDGLAEISMGQGNSPARKGSFQLHEDTSYTPFKYIYVSTHARLPAKIKNESTFQYYKGTVWPSAKNTAAENLRRDIKTLAGIPQDRDPVQWLFTNAEKQRVGWQRENSKLSSKDAESLGLSLSVEDQEIINVMYENNRYITLAQFTYSYSGGAHGNYSTSLITISKSTEKTIKITDVFTAEGLKQLPRIIEQVARVRYEVPPSGTLEDNGFLVNKIPVSKEFYITSTGIGFLYAPYEIKSFADGEINLVVPLKAVHQYLNPNFKP